MRLPLMGVVGFIGSLGGVAYSYRVRALGNSLAGNPEYLSAQSDPALVSGDLAAERHGWVSVR